jgi:hemerythrin superfamily protein
MDAIKLLKKDHSTVKSLFNKFDRTSRTAHEKRAEIFDQVRRELQLHTRAEEEIFYPAVKAHNGDGRRLVSQAVKEHREIDELLTQLARLEARHENFNEKFETLIETVEHHIEEEEREIFQFAEENCSKEEIERLGSEIERRKRVLEQQLAA